MSTPTAKSTPGPFICMVIMCESHPVGPRFICCTCNADRSISDGYGADWDHTLFQPLYISGPARPAVHVVSTIDSSVEYRPDFKDAAGWRAQNMPQLPELNHWVSLSSDHAAIANASAVAASERSKQTAWQTREDAQAAVAQAEEVPGQEDTLLEEMKAALKEVGVKGIKRLVCTSEGKQDGDCYWVLPFVNYG